MRASWLSTGLLLALQACSSREVIGSSVREPGASGGAASGSAGASGAAGTGASAGMSPGVGGFGDPSSGATFDEPYRGQFHFSVPSMWLGAINALWFDEGL